MKVKGLTINQKMKRFEYYDNMKTIFVTDDGAVVSLAKIRARNIIEEAIKNWNENNPNFKLRSNG